jgi:nucleoside-diphosphate-sugar epimerase
VKRALVTGASGFVGRAAVEALKRLGYEVEGVTRRVEPELPVDRWHAVDLLDAAGVATLMDAARPSHVLHLAWTTEHGRYWEDPNNDQWVAATRRLLEVFEQGHGSRFVLAGSCAQYDWTGDLPLSEADAPRRPATHYGRAKQEASEIVDAAGLSTATALLFFPYGPYEQPERLVPSIARRLLDGDEAPASTGTQVRDFIHVTDGGGALAALLDSDVNGSVNIASGEGTRIADVAEAIARIVGRRELLRLGGLPGDDRTSVVASVARLRDEVGFVPRLSLEQGLRDAVEWWRQRMRRR